MAEDLVGDKLFEARVVLHFVRPERDVFRSRRLGQVAIGLVAESLEIAKAMEQRGGNDEHLLDGFRHDDSAASPIGH